MASKENVATSKKKERSADKCREWEKERRNRFNQAISQLGELIKQAMKNIHNNEDNIQDQTTQFPKIEIIQRAIIFIKEYAEEKSQLKSQIVALQIKLESEVKEKGNKKDASTQIYRKSTKCKIKNPKKPKVKKVQTKDVINISKVEPEASTTVTDKLSPISVTSTKRSLPVILPKPIINRKHCAENTIVVLPAPYVLPPRPIIFPAAPPTIVLLDSNLQPCKNLVPTVKRTQNEITKTTMVNILPISAYSHPLSLLKSKKTICKSKSDPMKKNLKKSKNNNKSVKNKDVDNNKKGKFKNTNDNEKTDDAQCMIKNDKDVDQSLQQNLPKSAANNISQNQIKEKESLKNDADSCNNSNKIVESNEMSTGISKQIQNEVLDIATKSIDSTTNNISAKLNTNLLPESKSDELKTTLTKETPKEKEKLPTLLETTLCENAVDGGNARLELAEELLAASPTAAFLMSFPLVSGNRADSPAEEGNNVIASSTREVSSRRNNCVETPQPDTYFNKAAQNDVKTKSDNKSQLLSQHINKNNDQEKTNNISLIHKPSTSKNEIIVSTASLDYQFSTISTQSMVSSACTITDAPFSLDFDCHLTKTSISNSTSSYVSNSNLFYNKNDPFTTVKNTIYSSSNIPSGHEFNSLSLYPCAMEKYASKNKSDYPNVEDNLMKITSSRLTYDIDLGWPHKSFEFVNCTTSSNSFNKDAIFNTTTTSLSSFNPEIHSTLGMTNKKEISSKPSSTYTDTITNLYPQPANFWQDDFHFYGNCNTTKPLINKQQVYSAAEQSSITHSKHNNNHYDAKVSVSNAEAKVSNQITQQISDKYTKKSPNKMHINWMTSETRPIVPMNNSTTSLPQMKELPKSSYGHINSHLPKKQESDANYFPIQINNLSTQFPQEEIQVWPSSRTLGSTEISIDPPPINLPTLIGDLALGPHDKKKNDHGNKILASNNDIPNCNNFLSVTQLMNRSNEMSTRYISNNEEAIKPLSIKQNVNHYASDVRKNSARFDSNFIQPYVLDEKVNMYDSMTHFTNVKTKTNKASEKSSKSHKNNYSAEALIRSGTQKVEPPKFMVTAQKYNNFNPTHESSMAQVSHFPPILDYADNSYTNQQLGTSNLYNTTTSTISNNFYTNFMPTTSNLMTTNYSAGNYPGDFIDYNQGVDCNYQNQRYEDFKMKNPPPMFSHEKMPTTNYRNQRRETATKHKLECSKKDSSKKYPNKKSKITTEVEDWSEGSHLIWHNRTSNKKHSNLVNEELSFPNYATGQVPSQYQTEFFNSHLLPTNVQSVGHNMDRSVPSFPVTSRANFNLSTIFPEITMKVQ